ncbi:hypothetical protein [Mesorhizobium sp.]|uniref:hypothetical protein n=1 Tax=Mesorhizobium sp. TaxID=1871066 RepID=UPI000FD3AB55|nr:hypothetical protein [Mesorhizobium sp.]RVC64056.1 hypothetical protein EN779_03075 [Mesorhizobium sp. M4B.F.Ca.ET.088.02.2.1]RWF32407.1 MAG: hypothetical protein EOS45_06725 [Mesorhizobium sp.]
MNAHTRILKPLGMPVGMDPREWRQSVEKRLNDLLDRAMSLITALDMMEVDCDLEAGEDDEPSLGWCTGYGPGNTEDLERDDSDMEDDGTEEPTLGAPERHPISRDADPYSGLHLPRSGYTRGEPGKSQEYWADGARGDHEREEDHERELEQFL